MNVELTEEQKIKILNSSDVYMVMKQILMRENKIEREQEHAWCVCLAANNTVLNIEMDRTATIIKFCEVPRTLKEIMDFLKLKNRKHFFESILKPIIESSILKKTIPDKPTSKYQKYIAAKSNQDS